MICRLRASVFALLLVLAAVTSCFAASSAASELKPADILARVRPSVVTLITYDAKGKEMSQGSGFIATPDGAVVTCWHVVSGASKVKVIRFNGTSWIALGLLAWDTERDFAILKVSDSKLPAIPLAASDTVRQGDRVLVVGSPLGLDQTASDGMVSAVRALEGAPKIIQITAAVSPGSSGGPVLNMQGEVIGIAAFILTEGQNLNFAQTVDAVKAKLSVANKVTAFAQVSSDPSDTDAEKLCRRGWLEMPDDDNAPGASAKYKKALSFFEEATKRHPGYAPGYFGLGTAYDDLGRYNDAVDSYKEAIRLKPDYADAHNNLGTAYGDLGRYNEAVDSFKEAIRLKPDEAKAHYNLGIAYGDLGRYNDAVDSFKEAIRLKPDKANAHYTLGLTYWLLDDRGRALDEYKILKDLDADEAAKLFKMIYP